MKNAKKLLLLLLSLVLLIGVFTVAALAEETTGAQTTATVVYPDGTTQTVNVSETIVGKELTTEGDVKLYYGEDNTLFKLTGTDWTFTVVGASEALTDLEVTEEMAGKTILAGGAEQVYFTVYRSDTKVTEYKTTNTVSSHINATNFPDGGYTATITLYADSNTASFGLRTNTSSNTVKLDLNGHTITVKNRIGVTYGSYYIYSSKPGAHLYSGAGDSGMIWTNDGGTVHLGAISTGEYADNISFHAKVIFKYLYGNGINILGGHYYQTEPSQGFVDIARRVATIKDASFYLAAGSQSLLISDKTFTGDASDSKGAATGANPITNCKFYSPDSETPILYSTFSASPKFTDCEFHGVAAINSGGNGSVTADDTCTYGNAITYKIIAWEDGQKENYYPISKEAADNYIATHPNTKAAFEIKSGDQLFYVFTPIASIAYDDDLNATVTKTGLPVEIAFTYSVSGGELQYVPTIGTADDDGKNFHAILNNLSNVTIKMYSDIVLYDGVLFGIMNDADSQGRRVGLKTSGNVDWDLNGHKVTVDQNATAIKVMMTSNDNFNNFNALHYIGNYTFKLYSSVPGGEYINNSSHSVLGMDKYHTTSYLVGTSDPSVCGGENLKVTTAGALVRGYETDYGSSSPLKAHLYINGGTYIYSGAAAVALLGSTNVIKNATIITTGAAQTVFLNHYYKTANLTLENITVLAKNDATLLAASGGTVAPNTNAPQVHTISVVNATLLGKGLKPIYNVTSTNVTYTVSGNILASDLGVLSAAYPDAPEETTQAYTSVDAYNETYKVFGYFSNKEIVTVQNEKLATTELWHVGSKFIFDKIPSKDHIFELPEGYFYLSNAAWVGRVNGVVCEDICASKNAEKTVILTYEGELSPLYFTIFSGGETVFYHGDAAAAKLALEKTLVSVGTVGFDLTFYSDMTSTNATTFTLSGKGGVHYRFNLNGFTWAVNITATETKQHALQFQHGEFIIYSTEENAKMTITGNVKSFLMANDAGAVYLGERSISETQNGKNITFECDKLCDHDLWGNGLYVLGGTFVKASDTPTDFFINLANGRLYGFDRATFILNNVQSFFNTGWFSDTNVITENVSILSETKMNLFIPGAVVGHKNYTFSKCNFYNVVVNNSGSESLNLTFTDCNFNLSSLEAQTVGYIAYTNDEVKLTVNGVDYVFTAKLLAADQVGHVIWGNGFENEYWKIGATATHAGGIIIDGFFGYAYAPLVVAAGDNTPMYDKSQVAALKPGTIIMSLTLQSQIGLNLFFTEGLEGATITVDGTAVTLGEAKDGYYAFAKALAPNVANSEITIKIKLENGTTTHTVKISLATYAEAILKSTTDEHKAAHNLTYAMVEYVRAMTDNSFCAGVAAPAGYESFTLEGAASGNTLNLLTSIRFNLSGTIAIEVAGKDSTTKGKEVVLILPLRQVKAVIQETTNESGKTVYTAVFEDLYVNEFYGDLTITIEGEEYTYSLANYLNGLTADEEKAAVQALYNYAHYAQAYVDALPKNA